MRFWPMVGWVYGAAATPVMSLVARDGSLPASILPRDQIHILMVNDDGWTKQTINMAYKTIKKNNKYNVLMLAPYENQSMTGGNSAPPTRVDNLPGDLEFGDDSGKWGYKKDGDKNACFLNSFPVTCAAWGINNIGPLPQYFDGQKPDIVISGPNVGSNYWWQVPWSGTVHAAGEAAKQGIPAIAFSGVHAGGDTVDETANPDNEWYGQVADMLLTQVISTGKPYLPTNSFLTVEIPKKTDTCNDPKKIRFAVARLFYHTWFSKQDINVCGQPHLTHEADVIDQGCTASVVVLDFDDTDADSTKQKAVYDKLGGSKFFACTDEKFASLRPGMPAAA